MSEYWFARRFPVGHPRNAMAPVSRKGFLVVYGFVAGMVLGGVAFVGLAALGMPIIGAVVFVLAAAVAGWMFISLANSRGDHQRTVAEYKAGRGRT
jgi:membrane protein implicated in regulation of membrane protease activity